MPALALVVLFSMNLFASVGVLYFRCCLFNLGMNEIKSEIINARVKKNGGWSFYGGETVEIRGVISKTVTLYCTLALSLSHLVSYFCTQHGLKLYQVNADINTVFQQQNLLFKNLMEVKKVSIKEIWLGFLIKITLSLRYPE